MLVAISHCKRWNSCTISTGSVTIGAVTDNGDGTYTTVTNTVAESVTISGTLDGAAITDTATVTFTVGTADPTNGNTTLVAAPTSVVADGSTTSSVTVTLADASGNLLTASGGTVALSSTGSATIGAVTDNGDGTYTATVTNTVAERQSQAHWMEPLSQIQPLDL